MFYCVIRSIFLFSFDLPGVPKESSSYKKTKVAFEKLISRRGLLCSPDFTPVDFFLCGYIKSRLYSNNPDSLVQSKQNIIQKMAVITATRLKECHEHADDIV